MVRKLATFRWRISCRLFKQQSIFLLLSHLEDTFAGRYIQFFTMFGSRDSLPMHGGSKSNNGIRGIPVVDRGVSKTF